MTTITAKAIVNDLKETTDGTQVNVHMGADYGTEADPINQEWAAYTPGLSLVMGIKPELADKFPIGGHFTLTFELGEPAAEVPAVDPAPTTTETTSSTPETPTPSASDAGSVSAEPAAPASSDVAADPLVVAPATVDHNPYGAAQ